MEKKVLLEYDVMDLAGDSIPRRLKFKTESAAIRFYHDAKTEIEKIGGSVGHATYNFLRME